MIVNHLIYIGRCSNVTSYIMQVDPSFEGMDGGIGSLVKWNPVANVEGKDIWNFLRTMEVPVNSLHSQVCPSIISNMYLTIILIFVYNIKCSFDYLIIY